jgi:hypothetical protein
MGDDFDNTVGDVMVDVTWGGGQGLLVGALVGLGVSCIGSSIHSMFKTGRTSYTNLDNQTSLQPEHELNFIV